jgi:hypothetical protein
MVSDGSTKYYLSKALWVKDGWYAYAGYNADGQRVEKFLRGSGKKPKIKRDFAAFLLNAEGVLTCDEALEWEQLEAISAIGSGREAALALIRCAGMTAEQAIAGAIQVDTGTGGNVEVFSLSDPTGPINQVRKELS